MAEALAVKYRPKDWSDVCGQESVIRILERQLELGRFSHTYLFSGNSGSGKTTIGRILANKLNKFIGTPVEIDGASNNGVDNVKSIISSANERSIEGKYKIFIIDECHMLTTQAWNAFLKCIEEPPEFTIFIFCTTDPQKIPNTILNRVQRFNINKIKTSQIKTRLEYICEQEGFINYIDACDYLSRISNGGMRDAISMLEKCAAYDNNLSLENVLTALGNYSYDSFFKLTNNIIDGNEKAVLSIIEEFYENGNDLKIFVDQFLKFILDIEKYCLFKNINSTSLPNNLESDIIKCINFNDADKYYSYILDRILSLKNSLKNNSDIRSLVEIGMLQVTRCQ